MGRENELCREHIRLDSNERQRIKKREEGKTDIYSCMHDPRLGDAGPNTIVEGTAKVVGAINDRWKKTFERKLIPDRG